MPAFPRYALRIAQTAYAPNALLPLHHHERASISVVFRGLYEERVGLTRGTVQPFTVVWKPPAIEHSNHIGTAGLDALFVEVGSEWLGLLAEDGRAPHDTTFLGSLAVRRHALVVRRVLAERGAPDALAVEELLLEVCADARGRERRLRSTTSAWLERIRSTLHECAEQGERVPALAELAVEAGVHPVYLAQQFRARHGRSIGAYMRALRLERACDLLAHSPLPIGTIAIATGFADHSHFLRHFRAELGVAPGEYRRAARQIL